MIRLGWEGNKRSTRDKESLGIRSPSKLKLIEYYTGQVLSPVKSRLTCIM